MSNTTDTYWSVNGVSLQTLGFNISTRGGHTPPPGRGGTTTVPYRVGQKIEERVPDSRTLPFAMWAIGMTEDGLAGAYGPRAEYEKNYKKLRALIYNQGRPIQITKRWKDYGSNVVKSATAEAIYEGGLAENMTGPARSEMNFDLFFGDPFFYGAEETIDFPAGAATRTITAAILGDYPSTVATLQINGARTNPRLTNETEGHYVNVATAVGAGASMLLDIDKWTASRTTDPKDIIGAVTHFGHKHWLSLRPGDQRLVLSSASGTGGAVLKYTPRWL